MYKIKKFLVRLSKMGAIGNMIFVSILLLGIIAIFFAGFLFFKYFEYVFITLLFAGLIVFTYIDIKVLIKKRRGDYDL